MDRLKLVRSLGTDISYGWRLLRNARGFTAVSILMLALGIGANSAIFSLLDTLLLRTIPVRQPDKIVFLTWNAHQAPDTHNSVFWGGCGNESNDPSTASGCSFSYPIFQRFFAVQKVQKMFSLFAFAGPKRIDISTEGRASLANAEFVSADFFPVLGVPSAIGRTLTPEDEVTGTAAVGVLSYHYWQRELGSEPSVIGKTIFVNTVPVTIVGVAKPGFIGLEPGVPRDIWLPISQARSLLPSWPQAFDTGSLWVMIGARVESNAPVAGVRSVLNAIFVPSVTVGADSIFKPEDAPKIELSTAARGLATLRTDFSKPLYVLMCAVSAILLITCANLAGLMLVRGTTRQKEIALRLALGASRSNIVRQLLTESLMLSGAGAILGILFALWAARSLAAFLSFNYYMPLQLEVGLDWHVLAFTAALAVLTGLLFGILPSFRPRIQIAPSLAEDSGRIISHFGGWGDTLVVGQLALAVVLLTTAGLLVRTHAKLASVNVGFQTHNVLLFGVDTSATHYKHAQIQRIYRELQTRLAGLPGVVSASYSRLPLLSGSNMTMAFSSPLEGDARVVEADMLPVGTNFFETMGIRVLTGRTFSAEDFEHNSKPVPAIVNEALARELFSNSNPLGGGFSEPHSPTVDWQVVGVVADTKYDSLRKRVEPTAYFPFDKGQAFFELRTASDPKNLIPLARTVVTQFDSNLPLFDIRTQKEQVDRTLYQERLLSGISMSFSLVALVLACVGLYSLLSYRVARRTREIGIRMALGAEPRNIHRSVLGLGFKVAALGVAIGLSVSFALTRLMSSLLFGVAPNDPLTFAAVTVLLVIVTLLACYVPARSALSVDPITALRYE